MEKSIKKFLLESINDWNGDISQLSEDTVDCVKNVKFDKDDDYIKIDFSTSFGTDASILTSWSRFKKWHKNSESKEKSPYKSFLKDFLRVSKETRSELSEIIDDDGNIIGDDEMPPNTTNSMVGTSTWDTDKVYQSGVPKSIRMFSGDLGIGIITW